MEMTTELKQKLEDAVWAAHSLFERGKTSGSSANMSFAHDGKIYVSASGTCFGTLTAEDFSVLLPDGTHIDGRKPSKEWPLHLALYEKSPNVQAVIHTHSPYSILWSFVPDLNEIDCIPDHTPYLKMKLGTVGMIPYEKPGTPELFAAFRERAAASDGYLLKAHGPVVPGKICHGCFLLPGRAGRKRTHCLGTVPGRIAVKMPGISSKKGDFTQCVSSPSFF